MFYANTLVSISNAVTTDPRGNRKAVSPTEYAYTDVPASFVEQTQIVTNPVDGNPRQIRYITMRVKKGTVIKQTDLVLDQKTEQLYVVESVVAPTTHFAVNFGLKVNLRRVGGA